MKLGPSVAAYQGTHMHFKQENIAKIISKAPQGKVLPCLQKNSSVSQVQSK
jgi:hypothetical protein